MSDDEEIQEAIHGEMTGLVLEYKRQKKKLARAEELLEKWLPRVELAEEKGRPDLVEQARRQVLQAKQDRAQAAHAIQALRDEKAMLRHESLRPDAAEAAYRETRDEMLLEDFRGLGVDPEAVQLDEMADEQSADDALAALKAKMRTDGDD